MDYMCVRCGFPVKTLYVQYSPGNIRLMRCDNCKAAADEYIECEFMILFLDLILHKPEAYRHLLFNVLKQKTQDFQGLLWKSFLGFLILDFYRCLLLGRSKDEAQSFASLTSSPWEYLMMLVDVGLGNLTFVCTLIYIIKSLMKTSFAIYRDILLAIMISSYFKVFLIAMMVWEFPSSVIFIIDLFILSSNAVAIKVVTELPLSQGIGACFLSHAAKFLITKVCYGKISEIFYNFGFT